MVALGVVDPEHVVEQQVVAVGRREPLMGAAGRANHDLAKLADFGMNANGSVVCHDVSAFLFNV
jgi:hypothetical protein